MSLSHSPRIVTDGLVCCLDAHDPKSYSGSGSTWIDRSSNGRNGSLIAAPTYTGESFNLNGSTQWVEITGMTNFATANAFTCEVWSKSDNATWNNNGLLVSKRNQFIISTNSGITSMTWYAYIAGVGWQAIQTSGVNIQNWHCYTFVYTGGLLYAYINGELIQSGGNAAWSLGSDTGTTYIGKDDGIARSLDGDISTTRFYDRALTAEEILQNYNATKGRFGL